MSEERPKRMALIASQGTLDWAYPPFILASTAAAMEMEVAVFCNNAARVARADVVPGIDCTAVRSACCRVTIHYTDRKETLLQQLRKEVRNISELGFSDRCLLF